MTAPTPTPGASEATPTPTPGAPVPAPTPAPTPGAFDPAGLPAEAQEYLRQQIAAGDLKARTTSKANAAKEAREALLAQIGQALGMEGATPDPDEVARQLQEARDTAWSNGVQLTVHQMAADLGADPTRLLDSRRFMSSLNELKGTDPKHPDFGAVLTARIRDAVAADPFFASNNRFAAPVPPRSGGDFATGNAVGQITEAQLASMTPAQVQQAYAEGRLKHLM